MKAAIYLGKENIEIRELPMPKCGDAVYMIVKSTKQLRKRKLYD